MKKIRKAVFPAAGLGTRFLPATKASPKEMLPLVDKPLIQYVVEEAVDSGIEDIIIVTGRGKHAIEDHFDVSFELEHNLREKGKTKLLEEVQRISNLVNFSYVRQKEPLGLGHAILCAKHLVGDEPFAVLLGDDIIDSKVPALAQMIKIYKKYGTSILGIEEVPKDKTQHYGVIKPERMEDGVFRIIDLVEKPKPKEAPSNLAIIGRYILEPEIFEVMEKTRPGKLGELQLTDGLKNLLSSQQIYGYKISGRRYDAGDKLGFLKATVEFGLKNTEFGREFRDYLKKLSLD
ncbi:MAG: UTP--glucose-1-phosphate uridylyltransferase GalU [Nitrospirae bacterium]|nr:UTP--glucose-1-phosphate uridylyltransferase GalU [Nitrospirota bacterium]